MNCLDYALDKWADNGGGLVLVASRHWCIPHVQHKSNDGVLTEYRPPSDLPAPWHSLFGFGGSVVEIQEHDHRAPQNTTCMFLGMLILLAQGGIWAIKRMFR
jgi:hypothetical protein